MSGDILIFFLPLIFIGTCISYLNDAVIDNSIIYYTGNVDLIPCTYCTQEYFSKEVYYCEECYSKYNENNSIIRGKKTYHQICVGLSLPAFNDYYKDALCPYPISLNNGTGELINQYKVTDQLSIKTNSPIVGAKLKISCDNGYIPNLSSLSECVVKNNTPVWVPGPECRRIACLAVPDPENGISHCSDGLQANGSVCNISCKSGFIAKFYSSTCHEGNWTSTFSCVQHHSSDDIYIWITIGSFAVLIIVTICIICFCIYNKNKRHKHGDQISYVSVSSSSPRESTSIIISTDSEPELNIQSRESIPSHVNENSGDTKEPVEHEDIEVSSSSPRESTSIINSTDSEPEPNIQPRESIPSHVNENSGDIKEPVEHEDIEDFDVFNDGEPVENDERTTLLSNGSDLIHEAERLCTLDVTEGGYTTSDTVPKEVVPSNQTFVRQLDIQKPDAESVNQRQPAEKKTYALKDHFQLPETSQGNSQGKSTIPSNPSLVDFGLSRHPSDASFNQQPQQETAIAETNTDIAISFLCTNPVNIFTTENCDVAQDTGRGTMDLDDGITANSLECV